MKHYFFIAAAILLISALPSVSHAATINQWDVTILLNEDRTSEWIVTIVYDDYVARSDYFIVPDISSYSVLGDGKDLKCTLKTGPGSLITCDNIHARTLVYDIKTKQVSDDILQNFRKFSDKFSVTEPTKNFTVTVKLPLGSGLAESSKLGKLLKPFEPENGIQNSDGRRIFITWNRENPIIGDTLFVTVVYEQFSQNVQFILFGMIIFLIVGAFFTFIYMTRHRPVQNVMPVLTHNEKKVVEILLREKHEVDQRAIVKETDFSKAKASRVIGDLVSRGILEKMTRGRKNIIKLKKGPKSSKIEDNTSSKNKDEKTD